MKITDFVPQDLIPLLTYLGKHDWLEARPLPNNKTCYIKHLPDVPPEFDEALDFVQSVDQLTLINFFAASRALANGQKLLRPTYEQCSALEQIELNIAFDDYQQPFPALFVELPEQYRRELTERFGIQCPCTALCHHDKPSGYIFCTTVRHEGATGVVVILPPRAGYSTLEEALNVSDAEGNNIEQSKLIQRIGLNLCLMLTLTGVRQLGLADPQRIANLRRVANGSKRRMEEAERQIKQAMPTLITFEQEVSFYIRNPEEVGAVSDEASFTGRKNKPHWRKGFYKMQRFGPGRSQRKLIFIPPVLVNRHLFSGNMDDTKTVYCGKRTSGNL